MTSQKQLLDIETFLEEHTASFEKELSTLTVKKKTFLHHKRWFTHVHSATGCRRLVAESQERDSRLALR